MTADTPAKYGAEYLKWKSWGGQESFGTLPRLQEIYYRAEMRKTGLASVGRALEIGFGNGGFLTFCRNNSWRVAGTEENPALVEVARGHGFDAMPASALASLEPGSFDLIAAFDVLEHVDQDAIAPLLVTIRGLLRPGGVFLARFPNGDSPLGLSIQHGDITHVTILGSGKVEYFAKNGGFDLVSIGGAAQPIFGGSPAGVLRRLLVVPAKRGLEILFKRLFFPRTNVAYLSPSLVVCLRKPA